MKVFRADRGTLGKPVELPNGWLQLDGYIARTGVLEYRRADGSTWREYRAPEEAFAPATLDSFALVPLTNDHPADGLLHADNTREHQRGTVDRPARDGDKVRARILVTDAELIAEITSGKAELSCGYLCDVVQEPGVTPSGERYDARQVGVVGNHVAVVAIGRAGRECRLRLDSVEADAVLSDSSRIAKRDSKPTNLKDMIKITIGGVQYEVTEQVAQAFGKERADTAAQLTAAQADLAKLQARADSADASVTKLKAELADAPKKALETAKARAALEATAAKHLDGDLSAMSDLDIKRAVAEKILGRKLDGKAEAYVDASYELAITRTDADEEPATEPIHTDAGEVAGAADASTKAREAYEAALSKNF